MSSFYVPMCYYTHYDEGEFVSKRSQPVMLVRVTCLRVETFVDSYINELFFILFNVLILTENDCNVQNNVTDRHLHSRYFYSTFIENRL